MVVALIVLCCILVALRRRARRFGGVPPQGGMIAQGPGVGPGGGGFMSRFRGGTVAPGYENTYGGGPQMGTSNAGGMFSKFRGTGPQYPEPAYGPPAGPPPHVSCSIA